MFCNIISGGVVGVSACLVGVEVDMDRGLPAFSMVGSLSGEVRESRERVSVALKNSGFGIPPTKLTINLAPADVRKEGTAYDLPIAVGILQAMGYFPEEVTKDTLFLGELGLNGEVKRVKGVLPIVKHAKEMGIKECIVPMGNAAEGAVIPGIKVRGAHSITEVLLFLQEADEEYRNQILPVQMVDPNALLKAVECNYEDFAQVHGQSMAKRAAEIAAAGFHNLCMIGPPGAGKSMIAGRIPGILPPLTLEESLEITGIYSVAGLLEEGQALVNKRPFEHPHHSVSCVALTGGGLHPKPGLVSLAHRGILFLDEFPEFSRNAIDSMRQPLEDRRVQIARAGGNLTYPADFLLICAANPCPCGFYPDRNRCTCTEPQIHHYMGKISGPIMDRIDLWVELQAVDYDGLTGTEEESSAVIRERVMAAHERQKHRFQGTAYRFNADIGVSDLEAYCKLGKGEKALMGQLFESLQLSARAYHRILKVARTIADLEGVDKIGEKHLYEAAGYRPGDNTLQGKA